MPDTLVGPLVTVGYGWVICYYRGYVTVGRCLLPGGYRWQTVKATTPPKAVTHVIAVVRLFPLPFAIQPVVPGYVVYVVDFTLPVGCTVG